MNSKAPLVYLSVPMNITDCLVNNDSVLKTLRVTEIYKATVYDNAQMKYDAKISIRSEMQLFSLLEIIRASFLTGILFLVSFRLSHNVTYFVINPIKNVLCQLLKLSKNPFLYIYKPIEGDGLLIKKELFYIENLIMNMSYLITKGVGDLGKEILACNIKKNKNQGIDYFPNHEKVERLIAIISIKSFQEISEILGIKISKLLRNISNEVQNIAYSHLGFSTYSYHQKLMIVWKLPKSTSEKKKIFEMQIVSIAIKSLIMMIDTVENSEKLFSKIPEEKVDVLKKEFGEKPIKLQIGVQSGFGFDAVFGSDLRINPMFFSEQIEVAENLMFQCSTFNKQLLITSQIYGMIAPEFKVYCQHLNRDLFAINLIEDWNTRIGRKNFEYTYAREGFIQQLGQNIDFDGFLVYEKSLFKISNPLHEEFLKNFDKGKKYFENRKYKEAIEALEICLDIVPDDTVSKEMIEKSRNRWSIFMISNN